MIVLLFTAFYNIIENQERPQSKAEVSRIIRKDFFDHKKEYNELAAFVGSVNSYSDDWYLDYGDEKAIKFYSETSFDSCKLSKEEYISKYYHGNDAEASVFDIPDFYFPSRLAETMKILKLKNIHFQKEGECGKKTIDFNYDDHYFTPEKRTVYFTYFPDGMCREEIDLINKSDNKWNWSMFLDKNWLERSIKTKH
jgi:hypothetical protein